MLPEEKEMTPSNIQQKSPSLQEEDSGEGLPFFYGYRRTQGEEDRLLLGFSVE